jgi:adenosylcobinamide-GDP ribazoletransferase
MGQARHFLNAVQFLTLIPVRSPDTLDDDWLLRAVKYFPLVGVLIGVASALVFSLASMVWGGVIPALLAVATSAALTGALHEDGLSDTADGLGGGRSVNARLAIMKDSRIGTYGALVLGLGVSLRVAALASLPPLVGVAALIAVHSVARFPPIIVLRVLSHAGDTASAKVSYAGAPVRVAEMIFGAAVVLLALLPLLAWSIFAVIAGLLIGAALVTWLCRLSRRLVGGYTGDVLGAVEQMFEIGFLLGVAALLG